jgi:hypothetical protein
MKGFKLMMIASLVCFLFAGQALASPVLTDFLASDTREVKNYSVTDWYNFLKVGIPAMADQESITVINVPETLTLDEALDNYGSMDGSLFIVLATESVDLTAEPNITIDGSWSRLERRYLSQVVPHAQRMAELLYGVEGASFGTLNIRPLAGAPFLAMYVMSTGDLVLNPNFLYLAGKLSTDTIAGRFDDQFNRLSRIVDRFQTGNIDKDLTHYLVDNADELFALGKECVYESILPAVDAVDLPCAGDVDIADVQFCDNEGNMQFKIISHNTIATVNQEVQIYVSLDGQYVDYILDTWSGSGEFNGMLYSMYPVEWEPVAAANPYSYNAGDEFIEMGFLLENIGSPSGFYTFAVAWCEDPQSGDDNDVAPEDGAVFIGEQPSFLCQMCYQLLGNGLVAVVNQVLNNLLNQCATIINPLLCFVIFIVLMITVLGPILEFIFGLVDLVCQPICNLACSFLQVGNPGSIVAALVIAIVLPAAFIIYKRRNL